MFIVHCECGCGKATEVGLAELMMLALTNPTKVITLELKESGKKMKMPAGLIVIMVLEALEQGGEKQ